MPSKYRLKGQLTDSETRCVHYQTPLDIIALKFKCCETYYPCFQCHLSASSHPIVKYTQNDLYQGIKVILCGSCKTELTFAEYLSHGYHCAECGSAFNPGCALHYDLYFELDKEAKTSEIKGCPLANT